MIEQEGRWRGQSLVSFGTFLNLMGGNETGYVERVPPGMRYVFFGDKYGDIQAVLERMGKSSFFWFVPEELSMQLKQYNFLRPFGIHGFARDLSDNKSIEPSNVVNLRKVETSEQLKLWRSIVSQAFSTFKGEWEEEEMKVLWEMSGEMSFYLGYKDGMAVTTIATLPSDGDSTVAGLYWGSTLRECRNQHLFQETFRQVLYKLRSQGVVTVVLQTFSNGIKVIAANGGLIDLGVILRAYGWNPAISVSGSCGRKE